MSNEEKFIPETKVENTMRENNNQGENMEVKPGSLEEVFIPKGVEANDEKKLADARDDFKKMNASAEILSSTSTPRDEVDKSHKNFLEKLFSKK